jgi:hypothetical protein
MTNYALYTQWMKQDWVPYLSVGLFEDQAEALSKAQACATAELAAFPNDPSRIVVVEYDGFPKTMSNAAMMALNAVGKAIVVL